MAVKQKRNLQARIEEKAVVEFMQKCQQTGMTQTEVLYRMVRIFNLFGPNLFDLLSVEHHLPGVMETLQTQSVQAEIEQAAAEMSGLEIKNEASEEVTGHVEIADSFSIDWGQVKPFGVPVCG